VAGGVIRPGDAVTALPSGQTSRVDSIVTFDGPLAAASSPMSVTLTLENEIDLSRGDMLVSSSNLPHVSKRFLANIVWMHPQLFEMGRSYLIKHCSRQVRGKATAIRHRVNINTLESEATASLQMNDIATVELETSGPLFFDAYQTNRTTGSFIIIDPLTNATLAAGMIREDLSGNTSNSTDREILRPQSSITPLERYRRNGHYPAIFLVNSRPALARRLERALFEEGFAAILVEENADTPVATNLWDTLHSAGFVVIYSNSSIDRKEHGELRNAAKEKFFDLAAIGLPAGDAEAIEGLMKLASSLRISPWPNKVERGN